MSEGGSLTVLLRFIFPLSLTFFGYAPWFLIVVLKKNSCPPLEGFMFSLNVCLGCIEITERLYAVPLIILKMYSESKLY